MICSMCPRKCNMERSAAAGFCGAGIRPRIAKACLHYWEEPCISGNNGSGTVFFSGCNLRCKYCQNYQISQENFGKEISVERLSGIFDELQSKGAHNINLVNPSHYVLSIREALIKSDLQIPVVYNTNSFETIESLRLLEGYADIYLPDIKYMSSDISLKYSDSGEYFGFASKAILEMHRQVGKCEFGVDGILKKGIIIRHLILPGLSNESIKILDWIKNNLPEDIHISLMSQYIPFYKASLYPELNRKITGWEYEKVIRHFHKLGFKNGYIQQRSSASDKYIPDFNLQGV